MIRIDITLRDAVIQSLIEQVVKAQDAYEQTPSEFNRYHLAIAERRAKSAIQLLVDE